ncbi:MAG TPA: ATPase inhibitor subunit zeta, partial [Stellaceae bacterium]|nr:ATPase inhibitor subunit zeta [Stellaceae bacterium]
MPSFEDREKEFEARFKHDQELQFKVKARRNRLLGQWAAEKMGL